jgi:hypothetical protein
MRRDSGPPAQPVYKPQPYYQTSDPHAIKRRRDDVFIETDAAQPMKNGQRSVGVHKEPLGYRRAGGTFTAVNQKEDGSLEIPAY